ncbi:cytochrome P450 82A3-like [Eucalyptus grandis]|uniref:cytochrome P450 82A3-like n=1 Tax=Eucalyptus grandis TaxID=71139 RepID=UPI00192E845D|nr:cytochrome P450 82A3-like [Eucalyptus grandis]
MADAVPFLEWLDVGGHRKAMKRTAKEVDSMIQEWLEEHRQKKKEEESSSGSMIAGGTDTTAITLTWALALLLNNPLAIKRTQAEQDVHVGRHRMVKESDLIKLAYVQAIVKETLRFHPPALLSGMREVTQDCTIGGYRVPAGTRLIVNLWKLQRDSRVWERPDEFEPERFLTGAHKDVDVKGQHFELIPFGPAAWLVPGQASGFKWRN